MKKRERPKITVRPAEETVDVRAFARQVVAVALEIEGITIAAQPPASEASV